MNLNPQVTYYCEKGCTHWRVLFPTVSEART
jgi:hypothetical protein